MIIALNNKSNLTKEEFLNYQQELQSLETTENLILIPSTIHLPLLNLPNINIGAQNVSKYKEGAHTGEIAASQLASYNVKYCLVGHSERRQEESESLIDTRIKIKNLQSSNIIPILCIGESKQQREDNIYKDILLQEITEATKDLTPEEKDKLIIAYEPIWSIGTNIIPTIEEITEVITYIKTLLPTSEVLYGGSVNEENIKTLKNCPILDGFLIGGLSLKPNSLQNFLEILKN